MSEILNLREAFITLKMYHSEQVLRRWLREGKINGIRPENRKEGWLIDLDDLKRFIQRRHLSEERLVAKLQCLICSFDKTFNTCHMIQLKLAARLQARKSRGVI